jgi:hypothetical protein
MDPYLFLLNFLWPKNLEIGVSWNLLKMLVGIANIYVCVYHQEKNVSQHQIVDFGLFKCTPFTPIPKVG